MKIVATKEAPAALGPYSQAIVSGGFVYCSGQIPINPATGIIEATDIVGQTTQAIANLKHVLAAAGTSLAKVVKTTVFITDLKNFGTLNETYAKLFGETKPARSCVEVSALPKGALLEIEAIAEK